MGCHRPGHLRAAGPILQPVSPRAEQLGSVVHRRQPVSPRAEQFVPVSRVPRPPATAVPPTAVNRIYHVAADDVAALQALAGPGRTKLESFTAHLWRLYARAFQSHSCSMGVVVDGRARVSPDGAMKPYFGNVLTIPYGVIGAGKLRGMALADVADDVHRWVAEAATGEHFEELVDWVEAQRPEPTVARAYLGVGERRRRCGGVRGVVRDEAAGGRGGLRMGYAGVCIVPLPVARGRRNRIRDAHAERARRRGLGGVCPHGAGAGEGHGGGAHGVQSPGDLTEHAPTYSIG
ncbi:hypothetical protein ACQ4PT_028091 [Festuca glaucescens]